MPIQQFLDAVCDLSFDNHRTGVWDNRRNQLCQKQIEEFTDEEVEFLYKTEKNSRHHVERRAIHRGTIDKSFKRLAYNRNYPEGD